jgi:hypothetical protein
LSLGKLTSLCMVKGWGVIFFPFQGWVFSMFSFCWILLVPFSGTPRSQTVTYVCMLLKQELLSLGLCFSILTIPVQAHQWVMHSLQYHLFGVLPWWSASIPPIALGSNG